MTATVPTPDPADEGGGLAGLAEFIHERFAATYVCHWSELDETERRDSEAWDIAKAVLAAGYLSPAEVEAKVAAAKAEAWDEGWAAHIESTWRDGNWANPYRADTIAATEGVDTERGRVVQSGEHRGRQKSSIASEPPVSEVAGSSPAPAHPAPASPVVSTDAVEALAAEFVHSANFYAAWPDHAEHVGRSKAYTEAADRLTRALLADPADSAGGGAG